jgi:hypothetical protein
MALFKGKELRVTLDKKDGEVPTIQDDQHFDHKVKIIFHQIERVGAKVFVGICLYVLVDMIRQVEVEKIKNQS